MKLYNNIVGIFILALLLTSCATGQIILPEKYMLDRQLETATEIYKYRIMDWDQVDQQSLLLRTGPSDYYLLVLKRPATELMFTNRIALTSSASLIRAGMDKVILFSPGSIKVTYIIEKMYRIRGNQQMYAIKKQLRGGEGEIHRNNQNGDKTTLSI